MMSFLALNMQVAEASVAMHEIPIATAAKEALIRQATAFPFLDDVCIGEPGPLCRVWRATTAYLPQQIAAELIERRFPFAALHESAFGTSRHFAAPQQFGRFRVEADIWPDFMSTRLSATALSRGAPSPRSAQRFPCELQATVHRLWLRICPYSRPPARRSQRLPPVVSPSLQCAEDRACP